jgi:polysaccharide deacetylase family protein (PEP-CTERM system associated)
MLNAFCVDLEDYYQVNHVGIVFDEWQRFKSRVSLGTMRILALMRKHGIRGTFFVVGYIAEKHPALIQKIVEEGHEIACHTYTHRMLHEHDAKSFLAELKRTLDILRTFSAGRPVVGFRAPSWSLVKETFWALDVLRSSGITYDASILPCRGVPYLKGIPATPCVPYRLANGMMEIPASVLQMGRVRIPFSLAGIFRLMPFAFSSWMINRFHRINNAPVIMNIHPWDLDEKQPPLQLSPVKHLLLHAGRDTVVRKLDRLFRAYRFGPMSDLLCQPESECN